LQAFRLHEDAPPRDLVYARRPEERRFADVAFGARLGCGGTSDVYALRAAAGSVGGAHAGAAVAKVPRFATAAVDAQFRREAIALRALVSDGADVPWGVSPDAGYENTPTAESNSRLAIWRRSRDAAGPVPADRISRGLPRDVDPVLARGLEGLSARGPIAGESDLRSEKETSRDDDDPASPDA
jgi:hypothetical protein